MQDDRVQQETRIRRVLYERLVPAMYRHTMALSVDAWDTPGEPVPFAEAATADYQPFAVGSMWGRPWGTTWFRLGGEIPAAWHDLAPRLDVEAVVDLGFHPDAAGFQAEAMVWSAAGQPLQGVHPRRTAIPLGERRGQVTLYVEAAANPAFPQFTPSPLGDLATAGNEPLYRFRQAVLGLRDVEVYHLLLDLEVLVGTMFELPHTAPRRHRLLYTVQQALDAIDLADIGATVQRARRILAPAMELGAGPGSHRIVAIGHAHIDTAWLWPLRETQRKCARTFASAVALMAAEPDYRFACSQAVQYRWIEQQHPDLFALITERVAAGQWEPVGGMWVEPDMNMTSGESIVRQLVHGQRYFESRFGTRCDEVWIPDVFGYPASLPQILVAAGCTRFVTQKLSWNQQNVFPHSTFMWRGLDGSEVLTHFPPVDTYNAQVLPSEVAHAERRFAEHAWSDWSLTPFGHGNGGGGPTREMVERAKRLANLAGMARVELGSVDQFFERVEAEIVGGAPIATWDGELYLETHRGTLTSQIRTKLLNRRCERLLGEAELWLATAAAAGQHTAEDPTAELDEWWKTVLLNQFHDILPGSSIAWVHHDAEHQLGEVAAQVEQLVERTLAGLAPAPAVANAGSRARLEVICTDQAVPGDGPRQTLHDGRCAALVGVAGHSIEALLARPTDDHVTVTERSMTNRSLAVRWDHHGQLSSVISLAHGRELLPAGGTSALLLAADLPANYDAWDLETWTRFGGSAVTTPATVEVLDAGPLLASVRSIRGIGRNGSTVTQTLTMRAQSARLDVALDIDWREDESLLSWHLPVDIHAREAACSIQFGHVLRPTHRSSSWDAAKFEICAQRWIDVSEPGFGVAVVNDSRYGHSVQLGGITVSLLRAANYPDPNADRGRHQVRLGIVPHGAGLVDVLGEAEALNVALRVIDGAAPAWPDAVVTIDNPGVEVSAVKRADDGTGDLIVRCFEATGDRQLLNLRTPTPIAAAWRCNVLEEPLADGAVEVGDGLVSLPIRPFELVTLRLVGPRWDP